MMTFPHSNPSQPARTIVIGIAGPSGSGKSTLARHLLATLGAGQAELLQYDWYYRDHRQLAVDESGEVNFDHPASLQSELLALHLQHLKRGQQIAAPQYDFQSHRRLPTSRLIAPRPVLFVEGILVLWDPSVRQQLDLKVYIETDMQVCYQRRLARDMNERGRSEELVTQQWHSSVLPMFHRYVAPARQWADLCVTGHAHPSVAAQQIVRRLRLSGLRGGITPPA